MRSELFEMGDIQESRFDYTYQIKVVQLFGLKVTLPLYPAGEKTRAEKGRSKPLATRPLSPLSAYLLPCEVGGYYLPFPLYSSTKGGTLVSYSWPTATPKHMAEVFNKVLNK